MDRRSKAYRRLLLRARIAFVCLVISFASLLYALHVGYGNKPLPTWLWAVGIISAVLGSLNIGCLFRLSQMVGRTRR